MVWPPVDGFGRSGHRSLKLLGHAHLSFLSSYCKQGSAKDSIATHRTSHRQYCYELLLGAFSAVLAYRRSGVQMHRFRAAIGLSPGKFVCRFIGRLVTFTFIFTELVLWFSDTKCLMKRTRLPKRKTERYAVHWFEYNAPSILPEL